MLTMVTATYAKNNFGALIDEVVSKRRKVLVKRGRSLAVVISPAVNDFDLALSDKEIEGLEKGMKEFRKSFKFSF